MTSGGYCIGTSINGSTITVFAVSKRNMNVTCIRSIKSSGKRIMENILVSSVVLHAGYFTNQLKRNHIANIIVSGIVVTRAISGIGNLYIFFNLFLNRRSIGFGSDGNISIDYFNEIKTVRITAVQNNALVIFNEIIAGRNSSRIIIGSSKCCSAIEVNVIFDKI